MLKVGIIGSGFGVIGLLPAFSSVKNCKVVALVAKGSRPIKGIRLYADWQAMLEDVELDALALAVPPSAQYEIAKAAILKGLHVFAEKPLAVNTREAKVLLTLARKKRIVHGIDFIFPEIAEWKKVKELLDREALGALKHVSIRWDWLSGDIRYGRSTWKTNVKEGGGVLSFYFSHGLYYLEHFAGKIIDTRSIFIHSPKSLNGGEVGVNVLLKFKGGVTGNAHVSCDSPGYIRHRLVFLCERGVITLENRNAIVDNFVIKTYTPNGGHHVSVRKDKDRWEEDERVKIVKKLAARFVDACIHKKQMVPSFVEGLRVQELIEKVRAKKII
jgi:predicted dehydrogenase